MSKLTNQYSQAIELLRDKNFDEAKRLLNKEISEKGKYQFIAIGGLGYLFYKQKKFFDSRKQFEKKDFLNASRDPDFEKYVTIWAITYYNLSKYTSIDRIIFDLQNHKVENDYLKDKLGRYFDENHKLTKFLRGFQSWKKDNYLEKAKVLMEESGYKEAQPFIDRIHKEIKKLKGEQSVLLQNSGNIDTSLEWGSSLLREGTFQSIKKSEEVFTNIIEQTNEYNDVKIYLAKAKMRMGDFDGGLNVYEQLIENLKMDEFKNKDLIVKEYCEMAKSCLDTNDKKYKEKIRSYLEEADRILPSYPETNSLFGDYYNLIGQPKSAILYYHRYKALSSIEDDVTESKIYYTENAIKNKEFTPGEKEDEEGPSTFHIFQKEPDSFMPPFESGQPPIDNGFDSFLITYYNHIEIPDLLKNDLTLNKEIEEIANDSTDLQGQFSNAFMEYKFKNNNLYITKYKMNLFDYLHKNLPNNFIKDNDPMTYYEKIQIIKQINRELQAYYNTRGKPINYLNPYNIYICGETTTQTLYGETIKVPIIRLGFLPNKILFKNELESFKWEYENNPSYFFYSFALIIWEIFTRRIPFENSQEINNERKLFIYLKNANLSCEHLKNNIPLKIYDFIYKIFNRKLEIFKDENTNNFNALFDEVNNFPEVEYSDTEQKTIRISDIEGVSGENQKSFKEDIGKALSRFNCRTNLDFDNDFYQGIEEAMNLTHGSPDYSRHLAKFIGCAINGCSAANWYFYTEKLENSLANLIESNSRDLDETRKMNYLLQISKAVQLLDGKHGFYITCIRPEYIFECVEKSGERIVKIINYGKSLEYLQKVFPKVDGETLDIELNWKKITRDLIFDFAKLTLKMFKRFIIKSNNDNEIIADLERQARNNSGFFGKMFRVLITFVNIMKNNDYSLNFGDIQKQLENALAN